jgi:hypothetical protein
MILIFSKTLTLERKVLVPFLFPEGALQMGLGVLEIDAKSTGMGGKW